MQERRLLPNDWVTKLKAAQIKSEQLRNEFPDQHEEEAVRNLKKKIKERQERFIYKDAKEAFQYLIERTEIGKQKNFIGRYKNQVVKDWQLLLRIYESDNLYLAEYGKIVQQVHGFDLPSMKKQLQSVTKQINEGTQRVKDLKRSSIEQERKFNEECSNLGIVATTQVNDLQRQILKMVEKLISKFQNIESLVKGKVIRDTIEYYHEYNSYLKQSQVLQTLTYLSQYGDENIKVYEFKQIKSGEYLTQELQQMEEHKYDLYKVFDQIVNNELDQDDEVIDLKSSNKEDIDWSNIDTNIIECDNPSQEVEVSQTWTIIDESKEKIEKDINQKQDHKKYLNEETLLYNQETRQQLINDLEECEYFLKQRLAELKSKDQSTYSMYQESQKRKEIVKQCDQIEFIETSLSQIGQIQQELNNKDTLQLLLIRQKPNVAITRIIQKLMTPLKLKEKQEEKVVSLEKKARELQKEVEPLKQNIQENEQLVKEIVSVIQQDLSQKLKATVVVSL